MDLMPDLEVPVLIAGGSLVGMTSAMLLAHHGIRATVIEQHRGTAIHPRAALITQRSMEVLRTVGIESIVREQSEKQFTQDGAIMSVETLAGKEIAYFIPNINEGVRDVSPTIRLFITQKLLEPLLQQRAQELGADLRFATEMLSFDQDPAGVTAVVRHRDTGETTTIRTRYMISADGARSAVRDRLGIRMLGRGIFSNSVTIYFRAPVGPLLRNRNLSVILVNNPTLRGFFRIEKPFETGFLVVNTTGDPAHPNSDLWTGLTNERCLEYLRAALGDDSIPITIDDVMKWNSRADTAERFQHGRIFLAGDSAHVMPPYGGFGGNTGMQDAHNLAWKLAMVLKGAAGEGLLATYERERRPASAFTTEQAYARYVTREAKYLDQGDLQPIANDLNIELGYRYHSTAVIPDADDDGGPHENPRDSKGKPGARAPHLWLEPNRSTLDLFGRNFVLLGGPNAAAWCDAAPAGIDVHKIQHEGFCGAYGITPQGAVLVRPDGFVAWRAKSADANAASTLTQALQTLLRNPFEHGRLVTNEPELPVP
jgi:2-polyprenyl-6-methoxyphenol hydroxylase-like FAD-dependent oxidoreductase